MAPRTYLEEFAGMARCPTGRGRGPMENDLSRGASTLIEVLRRGAEASRPESRYERARRD